ncbi:MAG: hypothetical protein WCI01_08085 [Chlorobiaceae bacterium]
MDHALSGKERVGGMVHAFSAIEIRALREPKEVNLIAAAPFDKIAAVRNVF